MVYYTKIRPISSAEYPKYDETRNSMVYTKVGESDLDLYYSKVRQTENILWCQCQIHGQKQVDSVKNSSFISKVNLHRQTVHNISFKSKCKGHNDEYHIETYHQWTTPCPLVVPSAVYVNLINMTPDPCTTDSPCSHCVILQLFTHIWKVFNMFNSVLAELMSRYLLIAVIWYDQFVCIYYNGTGVELKWNILLLTIALNFSSTLSTKYWVVQMTKYIF